MMLSFPISKKRGVYMPLRFLTDFQDISHRLCDPSEVTGVEPLPMNVYKHKTIYEYSVMPQKNYSFLKYILID
jgi:hypothetical protein